MQKQIHDVHVTKLSLFPLGSGHGVNSVHIAMSCLGWRDQLHIVLLRQHGQELLLIVLFCLVNVHACASSVIHQDNEPLDGVHDMF